MANLTTNPCANCGNAAIATCAGCKLAPTYNGIKAQGTFYCKKECQVSHRSTHKIDCDIMKKRKTLYHACNRLQERFYEHYERKNFVQLGRISHENNQAVAHIHTPSYGPASLLTDPTPADLKNLEDKRAIVAYLACCEEDEWMGVMIIDVLKLIYPIVHNVVHFKVHLKNNKQTVVTSIINGLSGHSAHSILKVTLKGTDETYAIDLSAAQYGYYDGRVTPWEIYNESRVEKLLEALPYDHNYYFRKAMKDEHTKTVDEEVREVMTKILNERFDSFNSETGELGLAGMTGETIDGIMKKAVADHLAEKASKM